MAFSLAWAPPGTNVFPGLIFSASSTLFPLMALFVLIDVSRYKVYLPLFAAGKCIAIFSQLGWSIISRQVTIIGDYSGIAVIEYLVLSGDLLAIAAVLIIIKDTKKTTEIQATEVE